MPKYYKIFYITNNNIKQKFFLAAYVVVERAATQAYCFTEFSDTDPTIAAIGEELRRNMLDPLALVRGGRCRQACDSHVFAGCRTIDVWTSRYI